MRILIIGGHGTIGRKVSEHLKQKHEVIVAGRSKGDIVVDITSEDSIRAMYEAAGELDAVVCIAGEAKWALMQDMTQEDYYIGIKSKLMGQINLVRIGQNFLSAGASFTLSTGILADDPVLQTTSASMVNGAIHSFVRAAAIELYGLRINAVCAGLVEDSVEKYADYFPGHNPVPMKKVINAYVKSIEGRINGEIVRVYE